MTNSVILIGRTCSDVDQRFLPNGTTVARFTLAVDRNRKDANGQKMTDFIRCSAFSKTAEYLVAFVHKGRLISVEGSLHINTVNQADGTRREYAEVTVNAVSSLDYEKQTDKPDEPHQPEAQDNHAHPILEFDNDVPFDN